jgi:hypothetical protein
MRKSDLCTAVFNYFSPNLFGFETSFLRCLPERFHDFLLFTIVEVLPIDLFPIICVLEELDTTGRKDGKIHKAFVSRKIGK